MPMMPTKMVSMKRTPKRSIAEAKGMMPETVYPMDEEKYPYGLKIHLCHEDLEKLGFDISEYSVEDELVLYAKVEICEVSSNERIDSVTGEVKNNDRLELQITDLSLYSPMAMMGAGDNPHGSGKHLRSLMGMMK